MQIVKFYREEIPNPDGWYLADMWKFTKGELEMDHSYVQWLFPSNEPSQMNCDALTLTLEESRIFQNDPELQAKVKKSFLKMLDFFGFELVSENGLMSIKPLESMPKWLTHFNHNMLRVTRVLKCLRLTGLGQYAILFYHALSDYRDKVSENTWKYWAEAIQGDLWNLPQRIMDWNCEEKIPVISEIEKPDLSSLGWLKGKTFTFKEEIGDFGQREYLLSFAGGGDTDKLNIPYEGLKVLGDSKDELKNIMLYKEEFYYVLATSSPSLLCKFLEEVQPRIRSKGLKAVRKLYHLLERCSVD